MSSASGSNSNSDAENSSSASGSDSSDTESEHSTTAARAAPTFQQEADRMLQLSRVMDQTFARLSMRFPRTRVVQTGPCLARLAEDLNRTGTRASRAAPASIDAPAVAPPAAVVVAADLADNVIAADRTALSTSAVIPLQAAAVCAAPLQQTEQQRVIAGVHTEPAQSASRAALHIPPRDHSRSSSRQMGQSNDIQHKAEQPSLGVSTTEAARERGRQLQEAISILLHDTD
eukprot:15413-Heterococcus_DN1.PRE.3